MAPRPAALSLTDAMAGVNSLQAVMLAACRALAKVRRSKLPEVLALVNVNPPSEQKPAARRLVVQE